MNVEIANLSNYLLIIGLVILAIEITILGFSTFVLTFLGLALLLTGALVATESIAPTIMSATASVAVFSALLALILWKPLKSLQNKTESSAVKSDLVGYQFYLKTDISDQQPGEEIYSGVTWQVTSVTPLAKGTRVETVKVEVGKWLVREVE